MSAELMAGLLWPLVSITAGALGWLIALVSPGGDLAPTHPTEREAGIVGGEDR